MHILVLIFFFFVKSLRFLCITSRHLEIVTVFLLPFQLVFFFFPHLTAVAKTFNIMLNKVPRVEIIAPDLKENKIFQVFTTELPVGLSYLAFIMLSYVPSIFTLRVFVINGC